MIHDPLWLLQYAAKPDGTPRPSYRDVLSRLTKAFKELNMKTVYRLMYVRPSTLRQFNKLLASGWEYVTPVSNSFHYGALVQVKTHCPVAIAAMKESDFLSVLELAALDVPTRNCVPSLPVPKILPCKKRGRPKKVK